MDFLSVCKLADRLEDCGFSGVLVRKRGQKSDMFIPDVMTAHFREDSNVVKVWFLARKELRTYTVDFLLGALGDLCILNTESDVSCGAR